ncbi:MAG: flagellar biosynthetic protein FliR [Planctomycetes bacterium]|nr:flagellar biosynthetic protein FliR [Planctomycetota bacterium]
MNPLEYATREIQIFTLVLFRMSGFFFLAPVFGGQNTPPPWRIAFGILMALLLHPVVPADRFVLPANLGMMTVAVLGELGVGLLLGFAATFIFTAVQLGGMLIDQELGLGLANVIDPLSNEQVSVMSQFQVFLAIVLFLAANGHHGLIRALGGSYAAVPLAGMTFSDEAGLLLSDGMFSGLLVLALKTAAPAMVSCFLATLALAFVARTVPEMNIFVVGFSMRILVGFAFLLIGIPVFAQVFTHAQGSLLFDPLDALLRALG